ncbi:peptidoglycan-binding protein [Nocardioides sp. 503]|uniref:peptidoglycan-binding protein n=1 Tax=Nocardioides sp. 503 TaxID=2508326 RepID=UPI001430E66D|nr:peptidoglycan-binding protein [Nocardioides sp. 503]
MPNLKAFRFRYDPVLQACLDGTQQLKVVSQTGPFETGRHVLKIQRALLDQGFALPQHGADSQYGPETATAVSEFKTQQQLLPNDGVVGVKTMTTLDAIFVDEVPFPTPVLGPGEMTLDDFVEAFQAAEGANPGDSPEEFLTRVRQLYYPGTDPDGLTFREIAFDRLLPDAPRLLPDGSRRLLTPAGMDPVFFGRLSMRAPENPVPGRPLDNPSPYFYDATATRVDLGHLLLTVDALLHPRADTPYSDFPVPAIDPASWVADIGIGAVWAEQDGVPDAPRVLPRLPDGQPDLDGYYLMSAPEADLVGDVDGFNLVTSMLAGSSMSTTLVRYYVDGEQPALFRQRWRAFANTVFGTSDPLADDLIAAVSTWTTRVDRFNDLFAAGSFGSLLSVPDPRQWRHSSDFVARFFQTILDQLAVETDRFD